MNNLRTSERTVVVPSLTSAQISIGTVKELVNGSQLDVPSPLAVTRYAVCPAVQNHVTVSESPFGSEALRPNVSGPRYEPTAPLYRMAPYGTRQPSPDRQW